MNLSHRWIAACAAALGVLAAGDAALAQTSSTGTGTASIAIGNALTIDRTSDLSFGKLVVANPASPASVTVGTANAVTGISNATEVAGAAINSASFTVTGVGGSSYAVTFPQSSITLGAGANPPTLDSFSSNPAGSVGQLSGNSSGVGTQTLSVGGVLHLPANTPAGAYSGAFQVGVSYN
ncbi:MAG TPA: DUF4402 domain-containing protein [Phenylobacterium sp.]|jgi:hypothetical protein|nr:DUF4402 domain-containing protein [Phenylobacterium sp.]